MSQGAKMVEHQAPVFYSKSLLFIYVNSLTHLLKKLQMLQVRYQKYKKKQKIITKTTRNAYKNGSTLNMLNLSLSLYMFFNCSSHFLQKTYLLALF